MNAIELQRWDTRYREAAQYPLPAPDPVLFQFTPPACSASGQRRRALDLACGRGQNGLWLAEQGYSVDLIDLSREALEQAREQAGRRGLRTVNFLCADLDISPPEPDSYDLVCVFRYLSRPLFPALRASLKPGGRIIYETFHTGLLERQPAFNRAYLLEPGELAAAFSGWKLLHQRDTDSSARIVAIKPV